ncbi:MAG: hypothetical protein HY545_02685 [Candidatus Doudnabacteria bacterium]|nr:hypothetical protein [Candidatus Doudnabacteria bacterium]
MVQRWWGTVAPETMRDLETAILDSNDLQAWQRDILFFVIRNAYRFGDITPESFLSVPALGHVLSRLYEDFKIDDRGRSPQKEAICLLVLTTFVAKCNVIENCLRLVEQLRNAVDPTYRGPIKDFFPKAHRGPIADFFTEEQMKVLHRVHEEDA